MTRPSLKENSTWWVFSTGPGLQVKYSPDGLNWTQGVQIFASELSWWRTYAPTMGNNDVWAPDIHKFNGRYWCYYCVSEFGTNNSAIGLTSCSSIALGDWRDDGVILTSKSGSQSFNALDPDLTFDASGNPWLVYGSYFDGIHVVPIDPMTMKPTGTPTSIAARANGIEGTNIVYANGFYYLFASIDQCCMGVNSTYKIAFGRSTSITGPYADEAGDSMLTGGATILDQSGARWKGPGGESVYYDGLGWIIVFHAYDAQNSGAPTLQISDLYWDPRLDWPTFTAPAAPAVPVFSTQPLSVTVTGGSVALDAFASNSPTYQWMLDGSPVAGANDPILKIGDAAAAGTYTCVATNSAGSATSSPATLTLAASGQPGRMINLSCRAVSGTGANVLIAGFVVGGSGTSGSENVLVRASGPAIAAAPFNVPGTLSDPELQLTLLAGPGGSTPVAFDDGWKGSAAISSTAASVGAFPWSDPSSGDSAISTALASGPYTAEVSGASGDTGVTLAEVYDATPAGTYTAATPRLVNLSARVDVGTGSNVLIVGFVIGGGARTVLVRASGPAIAAAPFNVPGTLADPTLQLTDLGSGAVLASNASWSGDPAVASAAAAVGAFTWQEPGSKDSAILVTLPPGNYTAAVAGAGNDTGVALVEVYEVP